MKKQYKNLMVSDTGEIEGIVYEEVDPTMQFRLTLPLIPIFINSSWCIEYHNIIHSQAYLVLCAFEGEKPLTEYRIVYKDHNIKNCKLENLKWKKRK